MIEQIIQIYSGKPEDFNWVGFGSGSGTNLRECAKIIKPALIFSDRPKADLLNLEELADVPQIVLNGFKACGSWKEAKGNLELETEYNRRSTEYNKQILEKLREFEKEITIDLIVLGGYMRFVMDPLLSAFRDKIINVHPSDLPLNEDNKREYIGADAVYDAINILSQTVLGKYTRSSVIMVDEQEDHGEILVQGPELEMWSEFLNVNSTERRECLREYANIHQSIQKVRSDWPALTTTLKMISEGRIALGTEKFYHNEWRRVYIDGEPQPYSGLKIKKEN